MTNCSTTSTARNPGSIPIATAPRSTAPRSKVLAKDNPRWKKVDEADFVEIVGVDDVKRPKMLKDIALELRHDKDDLNGLEASIKAALDKARIRPAHWFG